MRTLFAVMFSGMEWAELAEGFLDGNLKSRFAGGVFLFFVMVSMITLTSMITAIFVDRTLREAQSEKEAYKKELMMEKDELAQSLKHELHS